MKLSQKIARRANAHNKGLSIRGEMLEWADEVARIETLFCCYDLHRACTRCRGPIESHRADVCTKCTQAETILDSTRATADVSVVKEDWRKVAHGGG